MKPSPSTVCFSAGIFFAALATTFGQPTITIQPRNQTASLFADVTFRVAIGGTPPFSYQWRFNDADLTGKTNAILTVTNVQRTNAGNYGVIVTNLSGSVTSQPATLTITPFNSIHCFGYSWTSAHTGEWDPPTLYWQGRPSNGPLWPELISTNLGLAYIEANNPAFASAGATEVLDQVNNFLAPPKPQLSLYFLMFSDDILLAFPPPDVNVTNDTAWHQIIQTGILNNSNAVSQLYAKGARSIVIQSEIDLSAAPRAFRDFGTNTAALSKVSEYSTAYNTGFRTAMISLSQTKPDLRMVWVDMFSQLNDVLANPAKYGFTKSTNDALNDLALTDKSFTGPGADYVFWNPLHGTAKLHELIKEWTLEALTNSTLETLEATIANDSPSIQMNHLQIGRDYTLQKSGDLRTWNDLQSFTVSAGTNQWSDSLGKEWIAYFRLKWQR
jgi:phospholipase/lecithinase/hemolysin